MSGKKWTMDDINAKGLKVANPNQSANSISEPANSHTQPKSFALGRLKEGEMNKTEAAYAQRLEMLKRTGEVLWYAFEPMNLRIGKNCFYKVDFMVMVKSGHLECHEVKGYWTDDALVKIRAAARFYPFRFISFILKKGNWETREF